MARVHFRTLRDKMTLRKGKGIPQLVSPVTAYRRAGMTLEEWTDTHGPFTPRDIIVIDTLTTLSEAAFNEAAAIADHQGRTRLNKRDELPDYGWMAGSVKKLLGMITDPDEFQCHVIVNTHIRYLGGEEEQLTQAPAISRPREAAFSAVRGLPNAKGQEVSRTVSLFFNTVLLTQTKGSGPGAKRTITTQPPGGHCQRLQNLCPLQSQGPPTPWTPPALPSCSRTSSATPEPSTLPPVTPPSGTTSMAKADFSSYLSVPASDIERPWCPPGGQPHRCHLQHRWNI